MLLLSFVCMSAVSYADGKLPTLASKSGLIVDKFGVSRGASVQLGALPKGTRGKIFVDLRNDTTDEIIIDRVKASCACLSPSIRVKNIPAGSTAQLEFVLETRKQSIQREISVSAVLVSPTGQDVRLNMRYVIEGVLATSSPLSIIEVNTDEELQRFAIPLIYTQPVSPDQIRLNAEKQLDPITFKIGTHGKEASILGEFPLDALKERSSGFSGRVFVEHAETQQRIPLELIVRRAPPVTLSPTLITMRREKDQGERFLGKAIVHVRQHEDTTKEKAMLIDVKQGSPKVQVTQKRIGHGIYRIQISCAPIAEWLTENRSRILEVDFQIQVLGETFAVARKLRFVE